MKWIVVLVVACCVQYGTCIAPVLGIDSADVIEQSYLVALRADATDDEVELHLQEVRQLASEENSGSNITDELNVGSLFRGYAATFTSETLERVRQMETVDFIEANQRVNMTFEPQCEVQCDAPWGIVRTTRVNTPIHDAYVYNPDTSGSGVKIYVLDTGIDTSHPDFGGRASCGASFVGFPFCGDPNGHGTHVAGIAMSNTYGVAKQADAVAVRVLNGAGFGSVISISLGIIWTIFQCCSPPFTRDFCNKCDQTCIINMSLGGSSSFLLDSFTNLAAEIGVHVAVAAGNSRRDACDFSPAGATNAVTVAASDWWDTFASFSNFGTCVDIIAPGVDITSTFPNHRTAVLSGTSQATPHVVGVMAKYLSYYLFNAKTLPSPVQLREVLINTASPNKIKHIPQCTLNLLVYKDCQTCPLWFNPPFKH